MIDWRQELLLIDKPLGITSFDVIRRLRRVYSQSNDGARAPKMGHAGTLDPLATGLMIVGVGPGTKQLATLTKLDKVYEAEVRLGESRTTGDLEGSVIETKPVNEPLTHETVTAALASLVGTHELPVSAYSAIKKDGVPMYKRARKAAAAGTTLASEDLPLRAMTVYEAALLEDDLDNHYLLEAQQQILHVRFTVASGVYIRSLAEELGRRLGYPACLQALRRTQVGEYSLENATALPEIK